MSVLYVSVICQCYMSVLYVSIICQCYMSVLYVSVICQCYMSVSNNETRQCQPSIYLSQLQDLHSSCIFLILFMLSCGKECVLFSLSALHFHILPSLIGSIGLVIMLRWSWLAVTAHAYWDLCVSRKSRSRDLISSAISPRPLFANAVVRHDTCKWTKKSN